MAIATSRKDPTHRGRPGPVPSWQTRAAPALCTLAIRRDGGGSAKRKQRSRDPSRAYSSSRFEAVSRSMRCGLSATLSGADRSAGGV